ncbi:hypothetical protein Theam_0044 [Thermovibrio ammonificans HB-1]|uniref:Uncharacterized protein n=2 Tax=Thermovibrio ammonificans TaxID=228745 RepID=E8T313_THEA1|nr:hypothetical protein Theam_0044 [Thermovibrio ammonificans HB-1]
MSRARAKVVERVLPYESMSVKEVLNTARGVSGRTYSEIADEMGIGTETVRRYHSDPDYNPPLPRVPELNRAYGNDILIQWLARKCGGVFIKTNEVRSPAELQKEIAFLAKEFSDVLRVHADAIKDNELTKEELEKLHKEAEELLIKCAEVVFAVKKAIQGNREGE